MGPHCALLQCLPDHVCSDIDAEKFVCHLSSFTVSRLGLSPRLFFLLDSSSILCRLGLSTCCPWFVFVEVVCACFWFIGALRIFTLGFFRPELCFVCHTRFLCGSSIKIGCCKLGPLWPCLSPPAPTLIHRCSSNIHAPALSAWVVFWAPYKKQNV